MTKKTTIPTVSKSLVMKCAQCSKACWFHTNMRGLEKEITPDVQNRFDVGHDVGGLAQQLFPNGIEVKVDRKEIFKAIELTKQYINDGHKHIFEATAMNPKNGLYSKIDVLSRDDNGWILNEVKSSTKVKDEHILDMAVQLQAFEGAGYKINKCNLILIDSDYIKGEEIDVKKLFQIIDVTEFVEEKWVEANAIVGKTIEVTNKEEPIVDVGPHCTKPYDCVYKEHCWMSIPKHSIFNIFTKKKAVEIYGETNSYDIKNLTEAMKPTGLKKADVEMYGKKGVHTSLKESRHRVTKEQESLPIHMEKLVYPLYFLDYETYMPAIPLHKGSRPYQQIPFQFSLHIQKEHGGEITHHEYLHREKSDPREGFAKKLVELCGTNGSVIVFNKTFEISRNKELANDCPKYEKEILAINERIWDLYLPFQKRWIYSNAQQSSASIKSVLPAFTDLSYDGMGIANGTEAMIMMENFVKGKLTKEESKKMLDDLHEYCKLDTWAMVKLLDYVVDLSKKIC